MELTEYMRRALLPLLLAVASCSGSGGPRKFVVTFQPDSNQLTSSSVALIAAAAGQAKQSGNVAAVIAASVPPQCTPKAVQQSRDRTQAVIDQLVRSGVHASKITMLTRNSPTAECGEPKLRSFEIDIGA